MSTSFQRKFQVAVSTSFEWRCDVTMIGRLEAQVSSGGDRSSNRGCEVTVIRRRGWSLGG